MVKKSDKKVTKKRGFFHFFSLPYVIYDVFGKKVNIKMTKKVVKFGSDKCEKNDFFSKKSLATHI